MSNKQGNLQHKMHMHALLLTDFKIGKKQMLGDTKQMAAFQWG